MKPLYTAHATAKGGRAGHITSDDGVLDLDVTMPKALGGDGARGTNPEQLFAAGYSACFGSALGLVARTQGINPGPFTITGDVSIGAEGKGFKLAVTLTGTFSELERSKAEALMQAAHQVCPYSNATRNNIEVSLLVA
jgi:Ohr subfamily peroxiredoxin